jgi:hypothetical protein
MLTEKAMPVSECDIPYNRKVHFFIELHTYYTHN